MTDDRRLHGTIGKRNAVLAIGVGGLIAGTLDLLQACILFGWDIPLAIAGESLGRQAFQAELEPTFSAYFYISLSRHQQRQFTTWLAAG